MDDYFNDAELTKLQADEHPVVRQLAGEVRRLAEDLLAHRMTELAVRVQGVARYNGLSLALWQAVVEGPSDPGLESDVQDLLRLSQQAGGWWLLLPERDEFMTFAEWEAFRAR